MSLGISLTFVKDVREVAQYFGSASPFMDRPLFRRSPDMLLGAS